MSHTSRFCMLVLTVILNVMLIHGSNFDQIKPAKRATLKLKYEDKDYVFHLSRDVFIGEEPRFLVDESKPALTSKHKPEVVYFPIAEDNGNFTFYADHAKYGFILYQDGLFKAEDRKDASVIQTPYYLDAPWKKRQKL